MGFLVLLLAIGDHLRRNPDTLRNRRRVKPRVESRWIGRAQPVAPVGEHCNSPADQPPPCTTQGPRLTRGPWLSAVRVSSVESHH